jgi:hypothetical protein
MTKKKVKNATWANVTKLFNAVFNCHSMVMPSFCVIKLYYLVNDHGMAVKYCGII